MLTGLPGPSVNTVLANTEAAVAGKMDDSYEPTPNGYPVDFQRWIIHGRGCSLSRP